MKQIKVIYIPKNIGLATTSRALVAFIALLADPDYTQTFRQMREQIDAVLQKDEDPRLEHKCKLPLVEAVRLYQSLTLPKGLNKTLFFHSFHSQRKILVSYSCILL